MDSTEIPAFIRPIQTSSFASLPLEILFEIEKKLKQSFENAFERQKQRMKFGSLCLSSRAASSGLKEVAVYDHRMKKLADLLEELGAGGEVKGITLSNELRYDYNALLLPSLIIDFGQLMKFCQTLTQLHLVDSEMTRTGAGVLGVEEMIDNGIILTHLTLTHCGVNVNHDCFLPLFTFDSPSHLVTKDLRYRQDPDHQIPTRFTSLKLINGSILSIPTLAQFLAPSIGVIRHLLSDNVHINGYEEEKEFENLYRALGPTLTHLEIGEISTSVDSGVMRAMRSIFPLLKNLEQLSLGEDCAIGADIYKLVTHLPRIKVFSIVCSNLTLPQEVDWPLLEFIKHPSNTLKSIEILPSKRRSRRLEAELLDRKEELVEAAKVSNLELRLFAVIEDR